MNLNSIFNPKSIAIIGASTQVGSVGNDVVKNLVGEGYQGKIYPVNPKATELYGLKCYADILKIKNKVDLAIIVVPAAVVMTVMDQVVQKKVPGVIVISAGFKEAGNVELENQLIKICKKHSIALIGPNCLGVINPIIKMNASFATTMPPSGGISFLSQSGALCTAVIDYAHKLDLGFSKFISVGNKAVVDEAALLEYLAADPHTKVVAMYVEQLRDAGKFIAAAKKIIRGENPKPVIVIKSGRTQAGASASASHTGALAGNDVSYQTLFKQAGAIRVQTSGEMFDHLRVFTHSNLPTGNRVAILTNAGGPGVLTTDEVIANCLTLAQLEPETRKKLDDILPTCANKHNPIDILGDAPAQRYQAAMQILAGDKNVDSLIIILTPQTSTQIKETAQAIIALKKQTKKPIVVSFMGGDLVIEAVRALRRAKIPALAFPEQAARSLAALTKFSLNRSKVSRYFSFADVDKKKVEKIFAAAHARGQTFFPEYEALEILSAYKFPLPKYYIATSAAEADKVAKKIGTHLAFKIISPDIVHKTDVGGVMLNVEPAQAGKKYNEMIKRIKKQVPTARLVGVLLMEMVKAPGGTEFILGINKDSNLGSLLMVGLGGTYVEVFKDVSFGFAPISEQYALKMLKRLKAYKILTGTRGRNPLAVNSLIECLGRLSQLATDFPEIKELDINPLLVSEKGAMALDGRVVIEL